MTDRTRYDCLRCDRTFLSTAALDRHYDRNPEHAEQFVIDADAIDATTLPGGEWVETDETVETFVRIAEGSSADENGAGDGAGTEGETGTEDGGGTDDSAAAESSIPTGAAAGVEMTYDPAAERLVIHGVRDRELDLSRFWEAVGDALTWSFDGTYHKIQFHKEDDER